MPLQDYITPHSPVIRDLAIQLGSLENIFAFVRDNIRYTTDEKAWGVEEYFAKPEETLALGQGDCDDKSFLLASLLIAAGHDARVVFMYPKMHGEPGHAVVKLADGSVLDPSCPSCPMHSHLDSPSYATLVPFLEVNDTGIYPVAKVSVVIPSYSEELRFHKLQPCLSCLRKQSYPPNEIIVVDAESPDQTIRIALDFADRVVQTPIKHIAHQRHLGTLISSGDIIVNTDFDTTLPKVWIERAVYLLTDPGITVVSGPREPLNKNPYTSILAKLSNATVIHPFGSNFAFRKEDFDRIGGYDMQRNDENLFTGKLITGWKYDQELNAQTEFPTSRQQLFMNMLSVFAFSLTLTSFLRAVRGRG